MQITVFSIIAMMFWSSVFILLMVLLRQNYYFIDICGVSGMIILYLFCFFRMVVPIEVPWTKEVPFPVVFNKIYTFFSREILLPFNGKASVVDLCVFIWVFIGGILCVRLIALRRRAYKRISLLNINYDDECSKIIRNIELYNSRVAVEVYRSSFIDMPLAVGILKKIIILPGKKYNAEELKYILMHEYVHHKNGDLIIKLMVEAICVLCWWNPIVHILKVHLQEYFEMRCDWYVVKYLDNNQVADYLESILYIFKEQREQKHLSSMKDRFKVVQRETEKNYHCPGILVPIIFSVIFLTLSYSVVLQSQFEPSSQDIGNEAYEINSNNSYIFYDGANYYLCTENHEDFKLTSKYLELLMDQDIEIREEK